MVVRASTLVFARVGRPDHLARRFTRNAIEEGPGEGGALGLQSDQPVLLLLVVLLLVLLSLVVKDGT
jgi:hypothetical protein